MSKSQKNEHALGSDSRDIELENVTTAFFLESALVKLKEEKKHVARSEPREPSVPPKPTLQRMQAKKLPYPSIAASAPSQPFPKGWLYAALFFGIMIFGSAFLSPLLYFTPLYSLGNFLSFFSAPLCLICIMIGYYIKGQSKREAAKRGEQIRNSAEYKKKCAEIDELNRRQQEELDEKAQNDYESAVRYYENSALPYYRKHLEQFQTETHPAWVKKGEDLQNAINETEATLQEIYGQNIIPSQYRNLEALTFIASFMGTSNYDLKFAIERYDKEIDHLIARENLKVNKAIARLTTYVLQEQQNANYLQEQTSSCLEKGNQLLRNTRNWAAAATALQAVDVIADWKRSGK